MGGQHGRLGFRLASARLGQGGSVALHASPEMVCSFFGHASKPDTTQKQHLHWGRACNAHSDGGWALKEPGLAKGD